MSIHDAAQVGFSNASDQYQRGRPEYPEALLGWLAGDLGAGPGARVVDVGAGTGKFGRLLRRVGATITAVEPVDEMRERIRELVPEATALAGTAEVMPLPDGAADAVVCAQAFHWFANLAALCEMHRVLRPGGRLGLVWNVRAETVDWVAAITEIITPYEGDAPRFYKGDWIAPFETGEGRRLFTPPRQTVFAHQHVGPFEQVVVDRILSVSFIAALPADERARVAQRLRALPERFPVLRADEVAFPYVTEAWLSDRLGWGGAGRWSPVDRR